MDNQQSLDFLFQLYDYADHIANKIKPGNINNDDYFLTLVFIEEFFDRMGRREISHTEKEIGSTDNSSKTIADAHKRLDLLRDRMKKLTTEYNFDYALDTMSQKIARDWHKSQENL